MAEYKRIVVRLERPLFLGTESSTVRIERLSMVLSDVANQNIDVVL